ncbi:regulatory protein RecX [Thermodesulfovibrio sp. TK110]
MKKQSNEALKYALRLITKKDRTEAEIRHRLYRKGFSQMDIEDAVVYLKQNGFIDDRRFIQKAEKIAQDRFLGNMGLKNYFIRRGIDKELVDSIPEIEEILLAQKLIKRKIHLIKHESSDKKRAKIAGYLLRRGFSWETVNKCLNEKFLGDIESPENDNLKEEIQ